MSELAAFLRGLPHVSGLPPELLERVVGLCRERSYARGERVFGRGEPCRTFHAVRAGGVRLTRSTPEGREQLVARLGPGASFAEAALLAFGRYPVDATAVEDPTVLVTIDGAGFQRLLQDDPRAAPAVISSLCVRLAELVERVDELSRVQAGERLARWLQRQPARGAEGRLTVELGLPKRELAAHLAMTPETLSRLLGRWRDAGWIESDRRCIVVLDAERLAELAEGEGQAP